MVSLDTLEEMFGVDFFAAVSRTHAIACAAGKHERWRPFLGNCTWVLGRSVLNVWRLPILFYTLYSAFRCGRKPPSVVVLAGDINQTRAVNPLVMVLEKEAPVVVARTAKALGCALKVSPTTAWILVPIIWPLLFAFAYKVLKRQGLARNQSEAVFQELALLPALVLYWLVFLSLCRCRALVVSNDHNVDFTSLFIAARMYKVPTFYLQHAHAAPSFPPLNMDFAFLDGEISARIYDQKPSRTRIFLTGAPRLQFEVEPPPTGRIGIAVGLNDELKFVESLVYNFLRLDLRVRLRPHPRHGAVARSMLKVLCHRDSRVEFCDSRRVSVEEFLANVEAVVASNCGIHLEAAACKRPSFYAVLGNSQEEDSYAFLEAGLAQRFESAEQVRDSVSGPLPQAINRIQACVGTPFEESPEMAIRDLILDLLEGRPTSHWQRDPNYSNLVHRYVP